MTRSVASYTSRIARLKALRDAFTRRLPEMNAALEADLGRHPAESEIVEAITVVMELNEAIRNLHRWMKPKRVSAPLAHFGSRAEVRYEPKGSVLILGPWNYPINLCLNPLISAIAAGNRVTLKPSELAPKSSQFIRELVQEVFAPGEVDVLEGGPDVAQKLLAQPFDHVFFTGSTAIGRQVMAAASQHLASVTLELGGKSPAFLTPSANLPLAARRIAWGKFLNAGQTCVAPDYVLVPKAREAELVRHLAEAVQSMGSKDSARIVNERHFRRLSRAFDEALAAGARCAHGGKFDAQSLKIEATLLSSVREDSELLRDEIFGPLLPIVSYESVSEACAFVRKRGKPLALYVFGEDKADTENVIANIPAGGTCVNAVMTHVGHSKLPFGGTGSSGIGSYHGWWGFRELSHERAVLRAGPVDFSAILCPPYTKRIQRLLPWIRRFLT